MIVKASKIEDDLLYIVKDFVNILNEKKSEDTIALDLKKINSYFNYFIVTTGNSHVHCRALAKEIQKLVDTKELKLNNRPEYNSGWIVLDFGEVIVHIFTSEMRLFYQLEKLWGDAKKIEF